jgi:hypothetical protein
MFCTLLWKVRDDIVHPVDPVTTSKVVFKTGSQSHKEYIALCETMKWDILPRAHKKLNEVQEKYGYNRNQLHRKFNQWKAESGGLPDI